jgi:hypothetical protein
MFFLELFAVVSCTIGRNTVAKRVVPVRPSSGRHHSHQNCYKKLD